MTEKTIALYARTSVPRADASLVVQVDSCRRFAATLGCPEPEQFIDRDVSGISVGAALDGLLVVCADGRFDAIVTATLDRILERLADFGVFVHFIYEESGLVADMI